MAGKTGWGGNYWAKGTWAFGVQLPVEIYETVPVSESLDVWLPLRVEAAVALNAFLVEVEFSHDLDYGYAPVLTPSNYIIPGLSVTGVFPGTSSKKVKLVTSEHAATTYTLTVADAHSSAGDHLDPAYKTTLFAGFPINPTFFAAAQSGSKVELIFSTSMLQNAAFTDPASYQVADLNGSTVAVTSATASGTSPIQRVTLELGASLTPGGHYVATILSSSVQTSMGLSIFPEDDVFQWADMQAPLNVGPISIPLGEFSGEVGDTYPNPNNLLDYPEAFDHPYWSKGGCTITKDATPGPLSHPRAVPGPLPAPPPVGLRADELVEDTSTARHEVVRTGTVVGGGKVTQSVYVKADGRSILTMRGNNPWGSAWFDLSTGELARLSTNWDVASTVATVEAVEEFPGWYRCSLTRDVTAPVATVAAFGAAESTSSTSYEGSGSSALYLYGAELVNTSLLGVPLGQVFFSPALDSLAADSVIQVDEVSVCTRAYDVYTIPSLPDPNPLSIYSPAEGYSTLLNDDVLWATAERLGLAHINLTDNQADTIVPPVDGPADATLQETFDQSKVALLNVEDWVLYDGVGTSFFCADNTAPVGPGATTNINLQP
jgi:hypothetical protein